MWKGLIYFIYPFFCISCMCHDLTLYQAEQAGKQGNYQKAIALYHSIDEDMENPMIAYNCAVLYTELGEYQAALNVYKKIITKKNPDTVRIASLYNAAYILYEKKQYSEAAELLREALMVTNDKDVQMLYQCVLAGLDPGLGITAVTEMSAVFGQPEVKTDALIFTPVPYGILFPGTQANSNDFLDH